MSAPSPARDAIVAALDVLREKEAKLMRVNEALADTRREIKLLERTLRQLNGGGTALSADTEARRERRAKAAEALAGSDGPMSAADVADAVGIHRRGVRKLLESMVAAGEAVEVPGGFAAPAE